MNNTPYYILAYGFGVGITLISPILAITIYVLLIIYYFHSTTSKQSRLKK